MKTLDSASLARLRGWITSRSSLHAEDYRGTFLYRRVYPRLKATDTETIREYIGVLERNQEEAGIFLKKLYIPTTEFFRNPEVFEALGDQLVMRFAGGGRAKNLRILSAASSTGEEAVSLAILLCRRGLGGRVVALDRCFSHLKSLRAASYSVAKLERVDKRLIERYFIVSGKVAIVRPEIRRMVDPVCADLTNGVPVKRFDVVALRNFFIYLTATGESRLLRRVAEALLPGGLLVLGKVETLGKNDLTEWKMVDKDARIYERGGMR